MFTEEKDGLIRFESLICKIYVKFINLLLLTVRKNEQVMIAYNPQSIYAAGKMLNLLLLSNLMQNVSTCGLFKFQHISDC